MVLVALCGVASTIFWRTIDGLRREHKELESKVDGLSQRLAAHEALVPRDYVDKAEFTKSIDGLQSELKLIHDQMDRRMDMLLQAIHGATSSQREP